MKNWLIIIALLSAAACTEKGDTNAIEENAVAPDSAQYIVERAIVRQGGEFIADSHITFDFRDRRYVAERKGGQFSYQRIFTDSNGVHFRDVLTNQGLYREREGEKVRLTAKDSAAYANSVNSVIYFALLPYFLGDEAVQKEYLGVETIRGKSYYKIKVTFRPDGGGKDHDDEYIYWFRQDDYSLDYLAYNYLTDGGGARLREAYNLREIQGIRFADYINYKPASERRDVENFAILLQQDSLVELSKIETENVVVK